MSDVIRQTQLLVVDDDERSRRLLRAFLEPVGCKVVEAAGGREALECLEGRTFDAVLLDLNMPGIGGFEVLERIRKRWPMESLPVILVTGQDDAESRLEGLRLRANEFLAKPVDQAELLARIGMLLAWRAAQGALEERVVALEHVREAGEFLRGPVLGQVGEELGGAMRELRGVLREAGPALDEWRPKLEAVLTAIDEADEVAADGVEFARFDQEGAAPKRVPVDLEKLAQAAVEAASERARRRDIRLAMGLGTRVRPVLADVALAGRMLRHLILSALRHSPPGEAVDVFLSQDDAAGEVRVDVRMNLFVDHGATLGRRIGLGLCIRAIEAMGGRFLADGGAGRPSSFRMIFPVARGVAMAGLAVGGGASFAPGANPV